MGLLLQMSPSTSFIVRLMHQFEFENQAKVTFLYDIFQIDLIRTSCATFIDNCYPLGFDVSRYQERTQSHTSYQKVQNKIPMSSVRKIGHKLFGKMYVIAPL